MRISIRSIVGLWLVLVISAPIALADEATVGKAATPDERSATEKRGRAYSHLMRAQVALRQGEVSAAIDEIHHALEEVPESPDLLTESAELLLQWTGRISEAEKLARRARELSPEHAGAARFLADLAAARALGPERSEAARDEAIALYGELVDGSDPATQADVLRTLVQLRLQGGDQQGALEDVRRLVDVRPGDLRATQTLAQLLLRGGEDHAALEVLLDYGSLHPQEEELMGWAEQLANSLEAWPDVAEFLASRAPFREDAPLMNRFYGEALLRVGKTAQAVEVLERADQAHPYDVKTRKDLALAYRGIGRMADAALLFEELARESPEYPLLQQLLAETLENQNDVDGALEAYAGALRALSDREDVAASYRDAIRQRMALLRLNGEQYDDVGELLDALETDDTPLTLELRCRLAMGRQSWDDARKAVRGIVEAGKPGRGALLDGEIAVGEGKWSKARSRFEEAIGELGAYVRPTIAEVYLEAGKGEAGLELLRDWAATDPELADARFHLGVYLYEMDRLEEAERELREAFRIEPDHARALNFLGYSLAERRIRLDEALEMIERALEVDTWNGAYLDSLGWVYYQMGRFELARQPLERAARELPKDPVVLEHLGDVYQSLGDTEGAVTVWGRALASTHEDPDGLQGKIREARKSGRISADDGLR